VPTTPSPRRSGQGVVVRPAGVHDLSEEHAAVVLATVAQQALASYDVDPSSTLTLLNISENATFAVDDATTGRRTVLRVHRLGYHDRPEIEAELLWQEALRRAAGVRTPRVVPTPTGQRVLALDEGLPGPRYVVMFEWLEGTEPPEERLVESFELLGGITAQMHDHAMGWSRPAGFTRFAWDYDGAFGTEARWGRWQDGIAVGPAECVVLDRLDRTIRARLERFGQSPQRYGLIHADMRPANLLLHRDEVQVIDFDDCGWSWLLYDLAAALSFIEHDPRVPELVDAWLCGYRRVRALGAEDEAEIATFVMMRRLLLVAWIGSHRNTDLARSMGGQYTTQSCDLAETYLGRYA
jgi:Ser/Thr protein kinase RdoA (MazF antagonist)